MNNEETSAEIRSRSFNNIFKGDKTIWMIFLFLCLVSIIEVYSASSSLSYKGGNFWYPIIGHMMLQFIGLCCMVVVLNIPCRFLKLLTPFALLIVGGCLYYVLFAGKIVNGASRWIDLGFIHFQPSELAKGTLILAIAQILSAMQTENGVERRAFWYVLGVTAFFFFPIVFENFSTAFLIASISIFMMFIGRIPGKMIGGLLGVGALVVAVMFALVMLIGNADDANEEEDVRTEQVATQTQGGAKEKRHGLFHRFDTWKGRIMKFTDRRYIPPKEFDLNNDRQEGFSKIAIASSGIIGKGLGNSTERESLPQAYSDFIYSIIIEESGLWGAIGVAFLYIALMFRAGKIASQCEYAFPAYLVMGFGFIFMIQAMFNMAVAVGLAPVTGQTLPLISRGGTATIFNCVYIGVILSVSRTATRRSSDVRKQKKASRI